MRSPAVGAFAFDFDKDGWMDLAFTHSGAPGLSLWRNLNGKQFVPLSLPKLDWTRGWGLAALDYDNDGWIDLAAVGETASDGRIVLLRNEGPAGFRDVSAEVGLDRIHLTRPRSLVAADFFGEGATDLLITQNGAPPVLLRNVGGNRNHWLRAQLTGLNDNKRAQLATPRSISTPELFTKSSKCQPPRDIWGRATRTSPSVSITLPKSISSACSGPPAFCRMKSIFPQIRVRRSPSSTVAAVHVRFCLRGMATRFQFVADIIGSGIVGHWVGPDERECSECRGIS